MNTVERPGYQVKVSKVISLAELHRLRMLADWQLREEGYDPIEVNQLCREVDEYLAK